MKNNYAQLGQGFAHPENDSDDISATFLGEDRDENILTAIQVFNQNCGEEPSGEQLAEKSRVLYPAETIAAQPLGSMPCLRSSARASSFIQLPRLIPARSAASFNCWRNSELIRIWKVGDQPSPLGVLSRFAVDTYVHNLIVWNLLCTYVITSYIEKTTPQTVGAVPGRLAKTLSEVTLWLALSLPKHAPNLHGVFSPWVSSQIRSSMLLPLPNEKPAQKRLKDVSVFCHVVSVLRGDIMFNLQTLTAKARELRGNVVKAATTKGTRTMTPVYEREEQRKLRERIQQTQADWVLLWWDIATVVATNNTPMIFTERAGGVSRRRVIFQFNRRVSEEDKDPDLAEKISAEIPVVVRRLLANFANPEKARALLLEQRNSEEALEVKQKTDPLYAFCAHLERLADCVGMLVGNRNPPHRPRMYLYHAYLKFLEANGFEKPLTLNKFSEGMESAMREFNHEYRKERKTRGVVTNVELSESAEDWLPQAHPLAEEKR